MVGRVILVDEMKPGLTSLWHVHGKQVDRQTTLPGESKGESTHPMPQPKIIFMKRFSAWSKSDKDPGRILRMLRRKVTRRYRNLQFTSDRRLIYVRHERGIRRSSNRLGLWRAIKTLSYSRKRDVQFVS